MAVPLVLADKLGILRHFSVRGSQVQLADSYALGTAATVSTSSRPAQKRKTKRLSLEKMNEIQFVLLCV